jgi:Tol biopolymer transport system component
MRWILDRIARLFSAQPHGAGARCYRVSSLSAKTLISAVTVVCLVAATAWAVWGRHPDVAGAVAIPRPPRIRPDYSDVVIPPNIAPLNFTIEEQGRRFLVRISGQTGEPIELVSRQPAITIPPARWRHLLQANRGRDLKIEVYAEVASRWERYQPFVQSIAQEAIDSHLVHRVVGPIHNRWRQTAIHQRDLTGYDAAVVLDGESIGRGCVNCHSFPANQPENMLLGLRSATLGADTLFADGDRVEKLGSPIGYTAWHPSGRLAAYSVNKVRQFFHAAGSEVRDVIDLDSGLSYFRVEDRQMKSVPRASDEQRLQTYPAWSPDGQYLYYCSAPFLWSDRDECPPERYDEVKYDLMRIGYQVESDRWGEPETVLSAAETGLSILLPRISPDGRFLLFCMCRYGCFPVFQPSSDLYLMDLADSSYRRLEINSEFSESYHSWSSNSRWIAFSSRRQGGFFTRCYFGYVDPSGRVHKPFVLPQQDPAFYDSFLKSICVPELVTGPVRVPESALVRAARTPPPTASQLPAGQTPPLQTLEPYQQTGG